jgi:hypothetical protein
MCEIVIYDPIEDQLYIDNEAYLVKALMKGHVFIGLF